MSDQNAVCHAAEVRAASYTLLIPFETLRGTSVSAGLARRPPPPPCVLRQPSTFRPAGSTLSARLVTLTQRIDRSDLAWRERDDMGAKPQQKPLRMDAPQCGTAAALRPGGASLVLSARHHNAANRASSEVFMLRSHRHVPADPLAGLDAYVIAGLARTGPCGRRPPESRTY